MFKDIDIDKMLEHTTLDDFLRGLYVNKPQHMEEQDDPQAKIMKSLFTGKSFEPEEEEKGPKLQFTRDSKIEKFSEENLTDKAL